MLTASAIGSSSDSARHACIEDLLEKQLTFLKSAMGLHEEIRRAVRVSSHQPVEIADKKKNDVRFADDEAIVGQKGNGASGDPKAKEEKLLEFAKAGKGPLRSLSILLLDPDDSTGENEAAGGHLRERRRSSQKHAYDPKECQSKIDAITLAAGRSLGETFDRRDSCSSHGELLMEPLLSEADSDSKSQYLFSYATQVESVDNANASGAFDRELKAAKQRRRQSLFPQLQDIKDVLQESLNKPRYNVEELYHESGIWQRIAKSSLFNSFTLVVIVLNTVWMSIDTDYNKASILCKAPVMFQIADHFFCSIFSFEILARFLAFKNKSNAARDGNFVFDALLVGLMAWETWIMVLFYLVSGAELGGAGAKSTSVLRFCRVFRVMRVARAGRLVQECPELSILARSITIGLRSVMTILVLLMLVIYIFGIIFAQMLAGTDVGRGKFDSVTQSMNFLLLQVLCGFNADFIDDLWSEGWMYYLLFLAFLLLTSLTIMNMLIGILCDVVSTVAAVEKDEAFARELETQVLDLARRLDRSGDGSIHERDFDRITREPALAHTLHELGVDVVAISDYAHFVFGECGSLSYTDFLHMVSQFRGTKSATVKDCMDLRKYFAMELALVKCSIEACVAKTDRDVKRHDLDFMTNSRVAQNSEEPEETRLGWAEFRGSLSKRVLRSEWC